MHIFSSPLCIRKYMNNWKKKLLPNIWICLWECQTSVSQTQRHLQSCVAPLKPIMCLQDRWCAKDRKTLLLFHSFRKSSGTWTYLEFTGFSPPLGTQPKWGRKTFTLIYPYTILLFTSRIQDQAYHKIVLLILPLRLEVTSFSKPQLSNYSCPNIPCRT